MGKFQDLEQAGFEDCDIFISMTEYDEVNMASAVLAKNGSQRDHRSGTESEYSNSTSRKNILGFSLVVNPELLTARYIANTRSPKCPFCGAFCQWSGSLDGI